MEPLLSFTDKGIYCPAGDFYIDPWKPAGRAIITHGHSDHAHAGQEAYLCHTDTKAVLQLRLGVTQVQAVRWNEPFSMGGVRVSLHPAGHVIGSSQIRLEYHGEVWVVTGDYKTEDDGISGAFEPVRCHTLVTESTFGLPVYRWKPRQVIDENIINWILRNRETGKSSLIFAYSLGKAQRVIEAIRESCPLIFAHGAVFNMQQTLIEAGNKLHPVVRVTAETPREQLRDAVIIAPPSAHGTSWTRRFQGHMAGVCSGWMQVRGHVRRRNADAGFALSDHADWDGLLTTVRETGAGTVYVTHGFQSAFSRYCNEQGVARALEVPTRFGTEDEEVSADDPDGSLAKTADDASKN